MKKNALFSVSVLGMITSYCFALDMHLQNDRILHENIHESVYSSSVIPVVAHVVKMPIANLNVELIPAIGQRETVSSIARRTKAFVAINGANYRRGGNYNGNRVNLFYLHGQVYSDLCLERGAFGWDSKDGNAIIDTIFLDVRFRIKDTDFPVMAINQPRVAGQAVLYTDRADSALLAYTPGVIIIIDKDRVVKYIGTEWPISIPKGGFAYQIDSCPELIEVGMPVVFDYAVKSATKSCNYNDYDFVLGGAGLLIKDGLPYLDQQLYQEFSQGQEIVHCGDEVAADFHTRKMQEWLIELRHPRTALGLTEHHEICIVVVDGRQKHSEGLSLKELALFMRELGCMQALNIGGGGCTTLCLNGKLINSPSASFEMPVAGEERPVSEAICFFLKNDVR